MGKDAQNLDIRYHPEVDLHVQLVLHFGALGLDWTWSATVEEWQGFTHAIHDGQQASAAVKHLLTRAGWTGSAAARLKLELAVLHAVRVAIGA